jgi:hypothetical protein
MKIYRRSAVFQKRIDTDREVEYGSPKGEKADYHARKKNIKSIHAISAVDRLADVSLS